MSDGAGRDGDRWSPPQNQYNNISFGGGGVRPQLYNLPKTLSCYFYKDGDVNFSGVRLAINSRMFPSLDTLKMELTERMTGLPFGVRGIYTPTGRHRIDSIAMLEHNGRYICSSYENRAQGVDLNQVSSGGERVWRASHRPSSGQRQLNALLGGVPMVSPKEAWASSDGGEQTRNPAPRTPKKIVVMLNSDMSRSQTLLLYRRTAQSFEQILEDLSSMFQTPIRRVYTLDGQQVASLSAIFAGPETYLITGGEPLNPDLAIMKPLNRDDAPKSRKRKKGMRDRISVSKGKWTVWITTNDLPSAGTQAQVGLTLYGHKGDSGLLLLGDASGQIFQPGNIDQFQISVGNIGDMYKIRISHDNTGDFPSWLCDEVRMRDYHTGEDLLFKCNRWLSRDEDDGEICREIAVTRGGFPVLPVVQYEVTVYTGDLWNAGTNANVLLTIYGEKGDTGARLLDRRKAEDAFSMGKVDTFSVEAVSLGNKLNRVTVTCDGEGPGNGWFLDKIIIKEQPNTNQKWVFPCRRWLDEGEDDERTTRDLKPLDLMTEEIYQKQLNDYEKWKFISSSQVFLYSKMTQRCLRIQQDGSVDCCGEDNDPLGVFVILNKKGSRVFQSVCTQHYLAADHGKLLGTTKGGSHCEFMLYVQLDRSVLIESSKFPLNYLAVQQNGHAFSTTGVTSDAAKQFHVYCKGSLHDKNIIYLCTSISQTLSTERETSLCAVGRRGRLAQFRVHKIDGQRGVRMFESVLFPNQFIRITDELCDLLGSGDASCQFRPHRVKNKGYITLESVSNPGMFIGMTTDGRVRPLVDTGKKNIRFYPEVLDVNTSKSVPVQELMLNKVSDKEPLPPKKSRLPIVRKPKTASPVMETSIAAYRDGEWKVWVLTEVSAVDTDVALVAFGDSGSSGMIILGQASPNGLFQGGNIDEFMINLESVGKLYKIRLECIPQGSDPDPHWKVREVTLQDMKSMEKLTFKFNRWLSREQDDGEIMRELPVVRPKQTAMPVVVYRVQVTTGSELSASTAASVYVNLVGELGDTGRRLLLNSDNPIKFQAGQVDTFELEAVFLGNLKHLILSHDGQEPGEGWFCETVAVKLRDASSQEYIFPCNKWLDTGLEDRRTERVLKLGELRKAVKQRPGPTVVPVTVKPPLPPKLESRATSTMKYELKSTSTSPISQEVKSTSPIARDVRSTTTSPMKQDFTSMATSPFIEEVAVAPSPAKDKPKPGEWLITLTTGSEENMSTAASVVLCAYGQKGSSQEIVLASGNTGDYFTAGKTDQIKVDLGTRGLGLLYKVRIGLLKEDDDELLSWYLQKMTMKDLTTKELFTLNVNRWMSPEKEDGDVWREIPISRQGSRPLPVILYQVEVYTGTEPGSETNADLYIQVFGSRGDSGKRTLYKSKSNKIKHRSGQMDVFDLEAVTLDEISRIVIGHDCHDKGGGWFCEKIVIKEGVAGGAESFYFSCNKWLDEGYDDGRIERVLLPQQPPKPSKGKFSVIVTTCTDSKPPKRAEVFLKIYGTRSCTEEILLSIRDAEKFLPGRTDQFDISVGNIGDWSKIRIGRLDTDDWEGWHLDRVIIKDKDTGKENKFSFDRWMSRTKDDCDIVREQAVVQKTGESLQVQRYEVHVFTGDHWAAETDANVYINVFGNNGDSGRRCLYHSINNEDKFVRNQEDVFVIEAVTLEDLQRVVVSHDGIGHGAGWFLNKVTVKELTANSSGRTWFCICDQWFDDHEGDGKTERELTFTEKLTDDHSADDLLAAPKSSLALKYVVAFFTGELLGTDFTSDVQITIYGSLGNTGPRQLSESATHRKKFSNRQVDVFTIESEPLGKLEKLIVVVNGKIEDTRLFIQKVVIKEAWHSLVSYLFPCNDWLEVFDPMEAVYKELLCTEEFLSDKTFDSEKSTLQLNETKSTGDWTVWTTTGADRSQQMIGLVAITICGTRQSSEPIILGQENLQVVTNLNKPIDNKTKKPATKELDKKTTNMFQPSSVDKFLIKFSDVGRLVKVRLTFDARGKKSSWYLQKLKLKDNTTMEEFRFGCDKWFSRADDTLNLELIVELPTVRPDTAPLPMAIYTMTVITGDLALADSDAAFRFSLAGRLGDTGFRKLLHPTSSDRAFRRAKVDIFEFEVVDLGLLERLVIGHDGVGRGQGWFCHQVKLRCNNWDYELLFPCNRWFDTGCDDRKIERELVPIGEIPLSSSKLDDVPSQGVFKLQLTSIESPLQPSASENDSASNNNNSSSSNNNNSNNNNNNNNNNNDNDEAGEYKSDEEEDNFNSNNSNELKGDLNATPTIWVYGTRGVTGPKELSNGQAVNPSGSKNELDLQVDDIGEIVKIRVCSEQWAAPEKSVWKIKDLVLEDVHTKEKLKFDFRRFVGEVGGDICKELPALRANGDVLEVVDYQVTVETTATDTNEPGEPDPAVYINLYGSPMDSGMRRLFTNNNQDPKFQPGQVSVFTIQAVDLRQLVAVGVSKMGGSGWNLKEIRVKKGPFAPKEDVFEYNNVLIDDDDEIRVPLTTTKKSNTVDLTSPSPLPTTEGCWKVLLTVGEMEKVLKEESLTVILCGEKSESQSQTITIKSQRTPLDQEYKIKVAKDIGDVYKVRLCLLNTARARGLLIKKMRFIDEHTRDCFDIDPNEWIRVNAEDDGLREYPVTWPGVEPLKVVKYQVKTFTGSQVNAKTTGNVFIEIIAANGTKSGRRYLKSGRDSDKFKPGQEDMFEVMAVELHGIYQLTVGHDAEKAGAGWFLDKVVINSLTDSPEEFIFNCQRWLDGGEDDKSIVRTLDLSQPLPLVVVSPEPLPIPVKTATPPVEVLPIISPPQETQAPAGDLWKVLLTIEKNEAISKYFDQLVFVVYGEAGKSPEIRLGAPSEESETLTDEDGTVYETRKYEMRIEEQLDTVFKLRLGIPDLDVTGVELYISNIQLQNTNTSKEYVFMCDDFLPVAMVDYWIELPVEQPDPEQNLPVMIYHVKVFTGDVENAGTKANVHLMIVGARGDTGTRKLGYPKEEDEDMTPFGKGDIDEFQIRAVDLVDPLKVIVGHNGVGAEAGWFLEKIVIYSTVPADIEEAMKTEPVLHVFNCHRWLAEGEDDGLIEVELERSSIEHPVHHSLPPPAIVEPVPEVLPQEPEGDEWMVSLTVEMKEGLSQYFNELIFAIYGEREKSKEISLGFPKGESEIALEEDAVFETMKYELRIGEELGRVYKLRLGLPEIDKPDVKLFVKQVHLLNVKTSEEYVFVVNCVLPTAGYSNADYWIELPAEQPDPENKLPVLTYNVKVHTSDIEKGGTKANVYLMITGKRGDTGIRQLNYTKESKEDRYRFGKGDIDVFQIQAVDLIEPVKVLIGHDGHGAGAGWFLEDVVISCKLLKQIDDESQIDPTTYVFRCNRWLDEGEGDGLIEIELEPSVQVSEPVVEEEEQNSERIDEPNVLVDDPLVVWKVSMLTGLYQPEAIDDEFDGNVGEDDEVEEGELNTNNNAKNRMVEEVDWEPDMGEGSDDEINEIMFQGKPQRKPRSEKYNLTPGPPTGQLMIVIYGEFGKTDQLPLMSDKSPFEMFQPGSMESFEVKVPKTIGSLYKVRVGFAEDTVDDQNWLLDVIVMEDTRSGKQCLFELRDRLIKDETSDGWKEIPVTLRINDIVETESMFIEETLLKPLPVYRYKISVYTGFLDNAGTDATVNVRLLGKRGCTGRRKLLQSLTGSTRKLFQTGQMTEFEIEAVDLLDLTKLIVAHDSKEPGKGWFLDKINVDLSLEGNNMEYRFVCNRWLDSGEDDGRTERELDVVPRSLDVEDAQEAPAASAPVPYLWKVIVHTAAATTAANENGVSIPETPIYSYSNLVLVVYGDQGRSEELVLVNEKSSTSAILQPGAIDEFQVDTVTPAGKLYKVRVCFSDTIQDNSEWILDSIILQDLQTQIMYTFELNDKIYNGSMTDHWKEIPVKPATTDIVLSETAFFEEQLLQPLPVHRYRIEIQTDMSRPLDYDDGTVFVTLFGDRGDSGKRMLWKSHQSGEEDLLILEAVDLLDLKKIIIGHNKIAENQGWYLHKVIVHVSTAEGEAKLFLFECDRWLDCEKDDGRTEREVKVSAPPPNNYLWKVMVHTGSAKQEDSENIEFDAESFRGVYFPNLMLAMYGDERKSDELLLVNDNISMSSMFQPGHVEEFMINTALACGPLYKVRVGFSNDLDEDKEWILKKIVLQDQQTQIMYTFELNDKIYKGSMTDHWKEIPVKPATTDIVLSETAFFEEQLLQLLPVYRYRIEVQTDMSRSIDYKDGTAFVTLFGERGDTGKRKLWKSLQDGEEELLIIEAVDLLDLKKIVFGHEQIEEGQGWYLDKVIVHAFTDSGSKKYFFKCDRWLDCGKDDCQTEREIDVVADPPRNTYLWKVIIRTGNLQQEGDDNIEFDAESFRGVYFPSLVLAMYGDEGKSDELLLVNDNLSMSSMFQPGHVEEFMINTTTPCGKVYKVRVGLSNDLSDDKEWILETLVLQDLQTGLMYSFELNKKLHNRSTSDQWKEIAVKPLTDVTNHSETAFIESQLIQPLPVFRYLIEIQTSMDNPIHPSSNVFMTLFGKRGDTGRRKLWKSLVDGEEELYVIEAVNILDVQKIVIGHDDIEEGQGWYLKNVTVHVSTDSGLTQYQIVCDRWFDVGKDDGLIEREFSDIVIL